MIWSPRSSSFSFMRGRGIVQIPLVKVKLSPLGGHNFTDALHGDYGQQVGTPHTTAQFRRLCGPQDLADILMRQQRWAYASASHLLCAAAPRAAGCRE